MNKCILILGLIAIVGCKSAAEKQREAFVADSSRTADSVALIMKPRLAIYNAAIAAGRILLKAPSSARFAALQPSNTDSSAVQLDGNDHAVASGRYESQNGFGVFLGGTFKVELQRKGDKWEVAKDAYKPVDMEYYGTIGQVPIVQVGATPPPVPAMPYVTSAPATPPPPPAR